MVLLRVLTAYCCLGMSFGLQCFTCEEVEFSSSSISSIKYPIQLLIGDFKSNNACSSTTFDMLDNYVEKKECSAGEVCRFIKGQISGKVAGFADLDAKFYVRDCVPDTGSSGKSFTDSDAAKLLPGSLGVLANMSDSNVSGDTSTCDTDLCVVGGCSGDRWTIGPLCLQGWIVVLIAAVALLLIVCAICCSCRNKECCHIIIFRCKIC